MQFLCSLPAIDFAWEDDGAFVIRGDFPRGFYRFQLVVTIAEAEWERFYHPMTAYGNTGQRTGPWDFDSRNGNRPLVPAWVMARDQRRVGLCCVGRPDAQAVATGELAAEFGFYSEGGAAEWTATPYRPFTLTGVGAVLEPDHRDALADLPWASKGLAANWLHHVSHAEAWQALADRIVGSDWERFVRAGVDVYLNHYQPPVYSDGRRAAACPVDALPLLAMAHRLFGDEAAKARVIDVVQHCLGQPAWGHPEWDGYGHNGDMSCATEIKSLAVVVNWIGDGLGELKTTLIARLEQQIDTFYEQQLLHSGYWGGAIAQDHGYRSSFTLATAALNMLGWSEKAGAWLRFYVPRAERCIRALPTDGFIPFSNYHKLSLYGLDLADFSMALRFASGNELFNTFPRLNLAADYLLSAFDEETCSTLVCCTRGDRQNFFAGLSFFYEQLQQTESSAARYLSGQLLASYRSRDFRLGEPDGGWNWKAYASLPFALLVLPTSQDAIARPGQPALTVFNDGGGAHFRHQESRLAAAVYCPPPGPSYHALGGDLSVTDCLLGNPSVGNFTVAYGDDVLLLCAESGYRTGTHLGNVLLVDGKGQLGDTGTPMAVNGATWTGARITSSQVTEEGGMVSLNLGPAYPDEAGLIQYTRELTFVGQQLTLVDTVVSRGAHEFSYCFHTYASHEVSIDEGEIYISGPNTALQLRFEPSDWLAELRDTAVVWSYSHGQMETAFRHIRFVSKQPTRSCQLRLQIVPAVRR